MKIISSQKAIVSKQSLRELTKKSRLPSSFQMFLAGGWLLQILSANSLEKKFRLMHLAYWAQARRLSSSQTQMLLTWRPIE
jgi:hypothetical protein